LDEIRRDLQEYFRENMGMYILITALFTGGVLAGALALRSLGEEQLLQLNRYFGAFIESFHDSGMLDHGAVFRQALSLNFRHLLLTWFMGPVSSWVSRYCRTGGAARIFTGFHGRVFGAAELVAWCSLCCWRGSST